jgi:hypothetical protein
MPVVTGELEEVDCILLINSSSGPAAGRCAVRTRSAGLSSYNSSGHNVSFISTPRRRASAPPAPHSMQAAHSPAWHKVVDPSGIPEGKRVHACIQVSAHLRPAPRRSSRLSQLSPLAAVVTAQLCVQLQGRYLTLLRLQGKVTCIDSICFHAGGPLVRAPPGCLACLQAHRSQSDSLLALAAGHW